MTIKNYYIFRLSMVLTLLAISTLVRAQSDAITQYYLNLPLYNPGFTGIEDFTDLKVGYKQSWTHLDNSDGTFYLSAQGSLGKATPQLLRNNLLRISNPSAYDILAKNSKLRRKHGIGGAVSGYSLGPLKELNIQMNYAYHIPVSGRFSVSLGTIVGISDQRIDFSQLEVRDQANDQFYQMLLASNEGRQQLLNISFGATLYSNNFFVALSMLPMVQKNISGEQNLDHLIKERNLILLAGRVFKLNKQLELQPIVKADYSDLYGLNGEANVRMRYNELIYLGLAYKKDISTSLLLGLTFDGRYNINYSYDYFISDFNNFNKGVHEVTFGVALFNKYSVSSRTW